MCGLRQAHEGRDLAQIVVHQGHIGRLQGAVGAHRPHGKADIGPGQCGRVVDAITDHTHAGDLTGMVDRLCTTYQPVDDGQLVFGQQIALRLIDTHLAGDGVGRVLVVTGQHQRANTQLVQLDHGGATALLHRIGHGKEGHDDLFAGQHHHGPSLPFQFQQACFQLVRTLAALVDQAVVAQHVVHAIDAALHTATGQRLEGIDAEKRDRRGGRGRR